MTIRVGHVSYLNHEPFYIDMERRGLVLKDVRLKDIPQALRDGEINAGPVSLVDSFELEDICNPIAGFCLSASNKAGSNLLYSKKPIEELVGATIAAGTADTTTRRLFDVLLAEKFNGNPGSYVEMADEHDAFVISGDDALRRRRGSRGYSHRYDLGEEWIRWTSLPFVFARWVLRNDLERQDALVIEDSLYTSLQDWADGLYRVSGPSDRVPIHPSEILTYTQGLRYFIGAPEEKSISLFQGYLEQLQQG